MFNVNDKVTLRSNRAYEGTIHAIREGIHYIKWNDGGMGAYDGAEVAFIGKPTPKWAKHVARESFETQVREALALEYYTQAGIARVGLGEMSRKARLQVAEVLFSLDGVDIMFGRKTTAGKHYA